MTEQFYADVPNRVVAFIIDLVLVTAVIFVGAVAVSIVFGPAVRFHPAATTDRVEVVQSRAAIDAVLSVVVSAVYFVGSWLRWGATPGQRALAMTVRGADGARGTMRGALTRWLLLVAPLSLVGLVGGASAAAGAAVFVLAAVWYAIVVVTTARDSTKRGIHDRLAGSVVTKAGQPAA
jgi:uncharacterized RDD family membrane protein YckC